MAKGNGTNGVAETGKRQSVFDITVFLIGTKPYLDNQYERDQMVKDLVYGEKRIPDRESPLPAMAARTIHRDADGNIVITCWNIKSSLCAAGCDVPLKGKVNLSKASGKVTKVTTFLEITDGEFVRMLKPDGTPATDDDWKVDVRRTVNPNTGSTGAAVRAKFDEWACLVHFRVDLSKVTGLTLQIVRKLVDEAGRSQGLGAFRKAFGRFVVADGGWLVTAVDESKLVRPKAPAHLMQAPEGAEVVATA